MDKLLPYGCTDCGERFPSKYALGGHRRGIKQGGSHDMGEHSKPTSPMLTDNGNPELVIDSVPRLTALVEGMRGAQVSKAVEQIVQAAQTAAAKDEVARIRVKNLDPVHAERFIMRLRPKLIRKGVEVSVMPSRGMLLAGVKGA